MTEYIYIYIYMTTNIFSPACRDVGCRALMAMWTVTTVYRILMIQTIAHLTLSSINNEQLMFALRIECHTKIKDYFLYWNKLMSTCTSFKPLLWHINTTAMIRQCFSSRKSSRMHEIQKNCKGNCKSQCVCRCVRVCAWLISGYNIE